VARSGGEGNSNLHVLPLELRMKTHDFFPEDSQMAGKALIATVFDTSASVLASDADLDIVQETQMGSSTVYTLANPLTRQRIILQHYSIPYQNLSQTTYLQQPRMA
jgi:hypothetical protein